MGISVFQCDKPSRYGTVEHEECNIDTEAVTAAAAAAAAKQHVTPPPPPVAVCFAHVLTCSHHTRSIYGSRLIVEF